MSEPSVIERYPEQARVGLLTNTVVHAVPARARNVDGALCGRYSKTPRGWYRTTEAVTCSPCRHLLLADVPTDLPETSETDMPAANTRTYTTTTLEVSLATPTHSSELGKATSMIEGDLRSRGMDPYGYRVEVGDDVLYLRATIEES